MVMERPREERAMTSHMQPLRDEHSELRSTIEGLRVAADRIGHADPELVLRGVDESCEFLHEQLLPHVRSVERVLYPVIDRVLRNPRATEAMVFELEEIERLVAQLTVARDHVTADLITVDDADLLRRTLYGLYALVRVHVAKEDAVYFPLLEDRLSRGEWHDLLESLGKGFVPA